ncbi:methyltransferase-like protein 27 [Saccoglossus kowalevskii]|uniref:Williams-Beuren syndrome chromosomal region 27 protein-like n=1 Tax=Saccoglossus kowalevskii TaxID=10224 RepID=A0ABM0MAQ0_SACKO|nr:PREDICTED: Williams-Beuren syndrome chromosomal region 27 protein-like [Saccoglossus kowalevskii]
MEGDKMQEAAVFVEKCYAPGLSSDELKNVYNEYSTRYDKLMDKLYSGPGQIAECMSKVVTDKTSRILDCGAGTGLVGEELHRHGYNNVDGIDISEGSLKVARDKGVYNKLICSGLSAEPIDGVQKDSYDAAVSSGCFIETHLDDRIFTELTRIIKPGGFICVLVHEKNLDTVEGDTFKYLIEKKALEVIDKYYVKNYVYGNIGAYFYAMKVLC